MSCDASCVSALTAKASWWLQNARGIQSSGLRFNFELTSEATSVPRRDGSFANRSSRRSSKSSGLLESSRSCDPPTCQRFIRNDIGLNPCSGSKIWKNEGSESASKRRFALPPTEHPLTGAGFAIHSIDCYGKQLPRSVSRLPSRAMKSIRTR